MLNVGDAIYRKDDYRGVMEVVEKKSFLATFRGGVNQGNGMGRRVFKLSISSHGYCRPRSSPIISPNELAFFERFHSQGERMTDKNEQALAMAYKRAVAKSLKIKELEITPDMSEEDIDAMVKFCAEAKAEKEGTEDWKQYLKGQR